MKPIVSDANLREAVVRELERDPEVFAKHISVTAIDGAVTLGGHVTMIHEKHVAVRAAERVAAVRAVADDIEVREPSLHDRADDEIAEEIAYLRRAGGPSPIRLAPKSATRTSSSTETSSQVSSETPRKAQSVTSPEFKSSTT
jgi:hypothetical protein